MPICGFVFQVDDCVAGVGFLLGWSKKEFGLTYHIALHSLGLKCEELHVSDITDYVVTHDLSKFTS